MYELEYLYEQLKTQTVERNYINVLNTVTENCYDIIQADKNIKETMNLIDEASNKNRFTQIDKLRGTFSKVEKVLDKYKDRALNCKPVGLVYNDYLTAISDNEIKKFYNDAIKYLTKLNVDKASEEELQKFIMDSSNNVQYKETAKIFGKGKETFKVDEIIFTQKDKEISKSDISDAVKYIKEFDYKILKIQDEFQKVNQDYITYAQATGIPSSRVNTNIEKLRQNAMNHQKALINIVDSAYYGMMYTKYSKLLKQAKAIVIKAANYNPRNLKESQIMQVYIDSLLEFSEY